ncbi:hypothetical protein FOL47_006807 [Perkinsus chesapeaki]|uniref:Uncharacterized protein n=1 Tax=Perkinsus chesapeaki TaxID=330153 RepID=A0A7J6MXD0_PERCH|nr:hypothetical protein FOL47_006807 [Perkinsus chesapeaki]
MPISKAGVRHCERSLLALSFVVRKLPDMPEELLDSVWRFARPIFNGVKVERLIHCSGRCPTDMTVFKRCNGTGLLYLEDARPGGWIVGELLPQSSRGNEGHVRIIGDIDLGPTPSACIDPRDGGIICVTQEGRVYKCTGWDDATVDSPAVWRPIREGRRISNYMHDMICTEDGVLWGLSKPRACQHHGVYALSRTSTDRSPRRSSLTLPEDCLVHSVAYSNGKVYALEPRFSQGQHSVERFVRVDSVGENDIEFTVIKQLGAFWKPSLDVSGGICYIAGIDPGMGPMIITYNALEGTELARLMIYHISQCPPVSRIYAAPGGRFWITSERAREIRLLRLTYNILTAADLNPLTVPAIVEDRGFGNGALGGTDEYVNITHQNTTRYYYLYTPNTTVQAILLNIHGLGDSCHHFREASGLVDLADAHGLLVVTPCGLPNGFLLNSFNAGVCCQTNKKVDDFGFIKKILAIVNPSNKLPVFSAGFSNGGMMSEGLLCLDMVTKAVSVSGVEVLEPGSEDGIKACSANFTESQAKIANVHGTADMLVPYGGNSWLGYPPVEEDMHAWSSRLDCATNYTNTKTDQDYDYLEYTGCKQLGSRVLLVRHNGGGHAWHGSGDFDTPKFVVDFLLGGSEEDVTFDDSVYRVENS